MTITVLVSVFVLIALFGFLLLSAVKFWKYSKLSKHSRFDLYPVPKEGKEKAKYGGSYFEETEWWHKKRHIDRGAEIVDIMKEMFLIKKLFDHQPLLWRPSFLFHTGIYIMFGWSVLLLIGVFWHPAAYQIFVFAVGVIGFFAATLGALVLLYRRLNEKALLVYTTPAEYFNLLLIIAVLTSGIYVWLTEATPLEVATAIFTLSGAPLPPMVIVHLILLGFMLIYIPLSKMGHYAGKFFSFRAVLWDNDPNMPGSKVDRNVRASAAAPSSAQWSAPHTHPDSDSEMEG